MKKILVLSFIAASALLSTQAMAQGSRSNINLEPTCQGSGGGMDPRCIGDVNPGNDRGIRRTRRGQVYDARVYRGHRHHVSRHYHARKRYALNCSLRANRANPRCVR